MSMYSSAAMYIEPNVIRLLTTHTMHTVSLRLAVVATLIVHGQRT